LQNCYLSTAAVQLLIAQSLSSNKSACHSIMSCDNLVDIMLKFTTFETVIFASTLLIVLCKVFLKKTCIYNILLFRYNMCDVCKFLFKLVLFSVTWYEDEPQKFNLRNYV
jgi:hypothetical protein